MSGVYYQSADADDLIDQLRQQVEALKVALKTIRGDAVSACPSQVFIVGVIDEALEQEGET